MFCKRCNNPLPSEGFVCKFCGALMSEEQIKTQKENMKNNSLKGVLASSKYSNLNKIKYNTNKDNDNKALMGAVMFIVIVFLIIVSIIIFFLKR